MTAHELSQQINADLPRWTFLSPVQRAQAVIDWCQVNRVDTSSILATPLAIAMSRQPESTQGPSDYLDMINSIAAFLATRGR